MKIENITPRAATISPKDSAVDVVVNQFPDLAIFDSFSHDEQVRAFNALAFDKVALAPDGRSVKATPEFANVIYDYLPMMDGGGNELQSEPE